MARAFSAAEVVGPRRAAFKPAKDVGASLPRVASFVPSATEWMLALGLRERLVAVTQECRAPAKLPRAVVSRGVAAQGGSAAQVDAAVRAATEAHEPLYAIDERALLEARPDVVIAQALCDVCAAGTHEVEDAARALGYAPQVVTLSPRSFDEALDDAERVAGAAGVPGKGVALSTALRLRLTRVQMALADKLDRVDRPRVALLEWTDPPYRCGHWFPDVVRLAGGMEVLGREREKSVPCAWSDVAAAEPDVIVVAPCGFDLERAVTEAERVASRFPDVRVLAVDASRYLSSSGPSLAVAVEVLAFALHPDAWPREVDPSAWREVQAGVPSASLGV